MIMGGSGEVLGGVIASGGGMGVGVELREEEGAMAKEIMDIDTESRLSRQKNKYPLPS